MMEVLDRVAFHISIFFMEAISHSMIQLLADLDFEEMHSISVLALHSLLFSSLLKRLWMNM